MAAALFALAGAVLAVITAHLLGAESELVSAGLLGFSPVLTAIALGTVFYAPSAARRCSTPRWARCSRSSCRRR